MIFAYTIIIDLDRELPESELDSFVKDLWSFKQYARVNGRIREFKNYMFNVYNETVFNTVNDKFGGYIRIYLEAESNVEEHMQDIAVIASNYDASISHYSCKFKVGDEK